MYFSHFRHFQVISPIADFRQEELEDRFELGLEIGFLFWELFDVVGVGLDEIVGFVESLGSREKFLIVLLGLLWEFELTMAFVDFTEQGHVL